MQIMKNISSTEARQDFSTVISGVDKEPITILKKGKEVAVIVSTQRYNELKKLEDILYGKAAELAIKEGLVDGAEVDKLLESI